jgi:D-sedoheptulose 7-phosphate isomerase
MNDMVAVPAMDLSLRIAEFAGVMTATQMTEAGGKAVEIESGLREVLGLLVRLRKSGGTLYIIGNGGSAAVASHSVVDFLNVGKLRATTIHDSSLITCMANDFGYENAYARILGVLARPEDMLVAISSSGKSRNIINAANAFRKQGGRVVTLSGFAKDNELRSAGDHNLWLDSTDYGFVEIGHQFLLHNLADRLRVEAGV